MMQHLNVGNQQNSRKKIKDNSNLTAIKLMRSQADREGLGKSRTKTRQRRACFSTQEILNMARNAEYAARGSMAGSLRFVFFCM